ncbi:MAG: hypothetical protein ACFFB2_14115 [Promethearchaeota archaeon]
MRKKWNSDNIAEQIIVSLSRREKISLRGIAEELGMSTSLFRKTICKLRREGLIESWNVVLNPSFQKQQIFFFLLKTNPNEPLVVTKLLNNYDRTHLSSLEGITGGYSLICRFHFPNASEFLDSLEHLYELVGETTFQKYQPIEVIKAYKEYGFPCQQLKRALRPQEIEKLHQIQKLGEESELPPSTYYIAKQLNVSQSVVYRQLKNWKDEKIILGYSINTPFWQEYYLHSYIQIKAPLGRYRSVTNFCLNNTRVIDIYRTNQEYSLLLKTRHPNLTDLNNFLKTLYQQTEVEDTITRIVLDLLRRY